MPETKAQDLENLEGDAALARPYARAVFELAKDQGQFKDWYDRLMLMAAVVSSPTMQALLDNPRLTRADTGELVIRACGEDLDDHAVNLVRILAENSRLSQLPMIAALYSQLRDEAEGTIEADVMTALDAALLPGGALGAVNVLDVTDVQFKEGEPLTFKAVTFNSGTSEGMPHDRPPDDGYTSGHAALSDQWYGDGLAWTPAVEATQRFFRKVDPDVVVFHAGTRRSTAGFETAGGPADGGHASCQPAHIGDNQLALQCQLAPHIRTFRAQESCQRGHAGPAAVPGDRQVGRFQAQGLKGHAV